MYPDIFTNFTIKRPLSNKERKILDTIILKSYSTKHDIRFNCTNNQYSITLTYKHSENKIKVKKRGYMSHIKLYPQSLWISANSVGNVNTKDRFIIKVKE